jgi:hypothetical protein
MERIYLTMALRHVAYKSRKLEANSPYQFELERQKADSSTFSLSRVLNSTDLEDLAVQWGRNFAFDEHGGDVLTTVPAPEVIFKGGYRRTREPLTADDLTKLRLLRIIEIATYGSEVEEAKGILNGRYGLKL